MDMIIKLLPDNPVLVEIKRNIVLQTYIDSFILEHLKKINGKHMYTFHYLLQHAE